MEWYDNTKGLSQNSSIQNVCNSSVSKRREYNSPQEYRKSKNHEENRKQKNTEENRKSKKKENERNSKISEISNLSNNSESNTEQHTEVNTLEAHAPPDSPEPPRMIPADEDEPPKKILKETSNFEDSAKDIHSAKRKRENGEMKAIKRTKQSDTKNIEKIIEKRVKKGITEYYVKWVGCPDQENSWVSESDISDKSIIDQWNIEQKNKSCKYVFEYVYHH